MESTWITHMGSLIIMDNTKMFLVTFITILLTYLTFKFVFKLICYKFKFKIKFKFNKLYQIGQILIATQDKKEISIGKLWFTSCYLNRNVNDRIMLCAQDIHVDFKNDHYSNTKKNKFNLKFVNLLFDLLGGGSINLHNFNLNFANLNLKLTVGKLNLNKRIKKPIYQIEMADTNVQYDGISSNLNISKISFNLNLTSSGNECKVNIQQPVLNIIDMNSIRLNQFLSILSTNKNNDSKNNLLWLNQINKMINIDKFKFIFHNDQNKEESICGDLIFWDNLNHSEVLLSDLDYFKLKKFNQDNGISTNFSYKLLKKFLIRYENKRISIESNDSNLYINIKYLKKLINLLKDLQLSNTSDKSVDKKCVEFEINLKNFYINLIDLNIYTIGAKQIDFSLYNHKNINFYLSKFLIFKSTTTNSTTPHNNSKQNTSRYSNNLFRFQNKPSKDNNSQSEENQPDDKNIKCLIEKLNLINQIKEKLNHEKSSFIHYWGCLLNINMLSLNHFNQNLSIEMDNIFIEHSAINLFELMEIVEFSIFDYKQKNFEKTKFFNTIKLKIKSINIFFLFNEIYLIYFNLNRFNLRLIDETKIIFKLNSLNCIEFDMNDDNDQNESDYLHKNLNLDEINLNLSKKFYIIKYYNEDANLIDSNFSLILLLKSIYLINSRNKNDIYITMNDILVTWSFRLHYIFNEELIKPLSDLIHLFNKGFGSSNCSNFKLNFLIESNILVNFLYDYEKDSSKISLVPNNHGQDETIYFNSSNQHTHNINTLSIILNNFYMSYDSIQKRFCLNVQDITMFINVDDQNISSMLFSRHIGDENDMDDLPHSPNRRKFFHAKKFNFVYLGDELAQLNNILKYERESLGTKQLLNRSIIIKFDFFSINFLFNYDFAKLIDHILNLRKCLLIMHNLAKQDRVDSDRISPDLEINIRKFQLSIEDDPFEIKLAYNYALMVDEHFESIKRHETLDQRRLIKEKNLEHEALEMLKEKESLIYTKRSKMLYSSNCSKSIRTQLFCFQIDSLNLYVLADLDWHGRYKCYDILRKIDAHSREPPILNTKTTAKTNPVDCFSILWCRHINIGFNDFQFLFRDYTQPLLKMNKFNMFGKLLGTEYQAHERSKRDVKIEVNKWHTFYIQRSMSPFKLYHDVCSKMAVFSFAYGPCWEGCMAQLNLSLDKIIHPPRDPSRPMPWWDKSRLYLHGRLTSIIQQTQIIYHVSMDPYNHTEEMKLIWTNLYFDWKNAEFIFKGVLDIYLNTESKYDDCCLLHLNNLEMRINIDWLCKKTTSSHCNANICGEHNYVMPCAPDKIPVIINSHQHDSFSLFRSENLNLSLTLLCHLNQPFEHDLLNLFKSSNSNSNQESIPDRFKFYASTSRFLQRIKNLLSGITRPTKRGRLFANYKQRKPILSRHFNLVNINIDIPKLNILYWSSANEEFGAQIECNHFKMNSTHKLDLIPFQDKLKRRPRPNWSIYLMKCHLNNINLYLMSPSNQSKPNEEQQLKQQKSNIDLNSLNQAEYDLYMLNLTSDYVSIKFIDSQQACKNFFMQIDSIYYERDNMNNKSTNSLKSYIEVKKDNNKISLSSSSITTDDNESPLSSPTTTCTSRKLTNYRPKHNLLIKNLKAKWNNINRDVLFNLYEIYNKSKRFRHNISSQALKECDIFTRNSINYSDYLPSHNQRLINNNSASNFSKTNNNKNNLINQNTAFYHKIPTNNSDEDRFQDLFDKLVMESLNEETSHIYCDDAQNLDSQAMNPSYNNDLLYGYHAANNMNDILTENVLIEFVNSQIKLSLDESSTTSSSTNLNNTNLNNSKPQNKSKFSLPSSNSNSFDDMTGGYLIISAAKTNVVQRIHKPVWKAQRLLDKISWSGHLENMQYFATVTSSNSINIENNTNNIEALHRIVDSNIDDYWLSDDMIDNNSNSLGMLISYENNKTKTGNFNNLNISQQNSNQKVKKRRGLIKLGRSSISNDMTSVNNTSTSNTNNSDQQKIINNERYLQLIVSKCKCEFYIIDYDDRLPNSEEDIANPNENFSNLSNNSTFYNDPRKDHLNTIFNDCIDCFTLIQHDLNLCTNSQQYKMIMNLVNNLVLYFRPRRKQILDKQKSIKFNLQLSQGNLSSLKEHIQMKQIEAKKLLFKLRMLERKLYHLREKIASEMSDYNLKYNQQKTDNNNKIYIIHELRLENKSMDKEYKECKKMLNEMMDELNISINCYKEMMLEQRASNLANQFLFSSNRTGYHSTSSSLRIPHSTSFPVRNPSPLFNLNKTSSNLNLVDLDQQAQQSILNNEVGRRYEIWFKQTQWKLLNDDIEKNNSNLIAKFMNRNFLYTKVTNQQELDCVEHTLEIESCKIKDLISVQTCENGTLKANNNKNQDLLSKDLNVLTSLFETQSSNLLNDYESEDNYDSKNSSSSNSNRNHQRNRVSMFRIYCKERPPVGIPVIEHLEVNVAPLSIKLTNRFFKAMINYFFDMSNSNHTAQPIQSSIPQPLSNSIHRNFHRHSYHVGINPHTNVNLNNLTLNTDEANSSILSTSTTNIFNSTRLNNSSTNISDMNSPAKVKKFLNSSSITGHTKKPSQSSLGMTANSLNTTNQDNENNKHVNQEDRLQIDDIEIMKQRSANNNTFLCIKITEIQLLVSYKGGDKEKNLKDLNNFSLLFPLFEVHDKTWTWLDLINALKSHVKKALLSQAIKHKLIKIPIQPVNKLISLSRRNETLNDTFLINSMSSSNMVSVTSETQNKEQDEKEKMTVVKLFGTKLIEKKSSQTQQPFSNTSFLMENSQMANNFKMNRGESSNQNQNHNDSIESKDNPNSSKSKKKRKGIFDKFIK